MSSGYAALAGAYYLGPSEAHKKKEKKQPANVPLMMLGTAMLLVGWFGFNAGSELAANTNTAQVLVNTHVGAATGMFGWTIMEYFRQNKLSASGFCIGCVAGLVGITPACGYVSTGASLWIGFITAIAANISSHFMQSLEGIEDTLDVFSCHGVGGTVGLLLTGLFANFGSGVGTNGDGRGLFYGNAQVLDDAGKVEYENLFGYCIATIIMMGPAFFLMALILLKITDMICPVRVSEDVEKAGLDISHHGETLPGVELITDAKGSTSAVVVTIKDPSEHL
jgi:Amt family ammonium transporter